MHQALSYFDHAWLTLLVPLVESVVMMIDDISVHL
jgi:hypothetical protein